MATASSPPLFFFGTFSSRGIQSFLSPRGRKGEDDDDKRPKPPPPPCPLATEQGRRICYCLRLGLFELFFSLPLSKNALRKKFADVA